MGVWSAIRDAITNKPLKINDDGSIIVEISSKPPLNEDQIEIPFSELFTNQLGSPFMNINPVADVDDTFCVNSLADKDRYISYITLEVSDQNATLDQFGGITELINGVDFSYNSASGKSDITRPIKKNLDFYRSATGGDGFGTGTNAFRADVQGGNSNLTYLPKFNLRLIYGLTHGVRLRAGTRDNICFKIQDPLGTLFAFNAQAYGKIR